MPFEPVKDLVMRLPVLYPPELGEHPVVMVGDKWINIDQLGHWMKTCDDDHSGSCHSITDPWLRLDVEEERLVWRENSCKHSVPEVP